MQIDNLKNVFLTLEKDEKSDIHMRKLFDGPLALFVASLNAGKKLPAHVHARGSEIYQILAGNGHFEIGQVEDGRVSWSEHVDVKAGDIFEVLPGMAHRLSGGSEDLQMIFFAPPAHLGDDRLFL